MTNVSFPITSIQPRELIWGKQGEISVFDVRIRLILKFIYLIQSINYAWKAHRWLSDPGGYQYLRHPSRALLRSIFSQCLLTYQRYLRSYFSGTYNFLGIYLTCKPKEHQKKNNYFTSLRVETNQIHDPCIQQFMPLSGIWESGKQKYVL